MTLAENKSS